MNQENCIDTNSHNEVRLYNYNCMNICHFVINDLCWEFYFSLAMWKRQTDTVFLWLVHLITVNQQYSNIYQIISLDCSWNVASLISLPKENTLKLFSTFLHSKKMSVKIGPNVMKEFSVLIFQSCFPHILNYMLHCVVFCKRKWKMS